MKMSELAKQIKGLDFGFMSETNKAINRNLTLRNWLIGYYIVEFEQHGEDRAQYGEKLIASLSQELDSSGFSPRNLRLYRQFFLVYPQLAEVIPENLPKEIWQSPIAKLLNADNQDNVIWQSPIAKSDDPHHEVQVPARKLIANLSFTHLSLLLNIESSLQRAFYEIEAIRGTWSVSELKRQLNTMLFERSSISSRPDLLLDHLNKVSSDKSGRTVIRDFYTFEFLGLPQELAVEESDLERALLNHLQEFILELGHGFCFEARQKRIVMGDEYFFIDLVFYHRIIKCHVLIELKVDAFNHSNVGQLNTYLNYYKREVMTEGDNPPVGILLVTGKNDALVEYATMGMDPNLFVSKYKLQLPEVGELRQFLLNELNRF
ncbi:MAG: DUF1016 family protein [Bacteroidia bacterium]|nr:DUF1016 family protein [Bacteroidia bacterium]